MKDCLECGKSFRPRNYSAVFCGGTCRRVFNNRRATRGATLYDLVMLEESSTDIKVYKPARQRIDRLLAQWRKEDGQRRRWKPARLVFEDTSWLTAERVSPKK